MAQDTAGFKGMGTGTEQAGDITAKVAAVLARYDPAKLTAADAKAINNAFRQAGVKRGRAQQEAIAAAGFDPHTISKLDPPPEHPKGGSPPKPDKGRQENQN